MSAPSMTWRYSLAQGVDSRDNSDSTLVRTADGWHRIETGSKAQIAAILSHQRLSESELDDVLCASGTATSAASVLYQLEQSGVLNRHLYDSGRCLVSCLPLRAPTGSMARSLPEGVLWLCEFTSARRMDNVLSLENPGHWATVAIHDRALSGLLHDLSLGQSAHNAVKAYSQCSADAVRAVLTLFLWCGILDTGKQAEWSAHERLFHIRTRAGYTREAPGKRIPPDSNSSRNSGDEHLSRCSRIKLPTLDRTACRQTDPPYWAVIGQRRSIRHQGTEPITADRLALFLHATVGDHDGQRVYPSGGRCYSIHTYVAIRECQGMAAGFYLYDPVPHELVTVAQPCATLELLLAGAASTAAITIPPQVLLVFSCRLADIHPSYPGLGYALALKEVGAIFQTAMLNATALDLASCPLGCGNSLAFAELLGLDSMIETSVGELMLGSMPAGDEPPR